MFETTKTQGPDKVQGQEPIIEMNLGILARVGGSLRGIVSHLKANRITDSEKRELEFDKDRRFEELLVALKGLTSRGSGTGAKKTSLVKDLLSWVSKIFGMGFAGFKAFFGKFLKFMKLGKIWVFLKLAGVILGRIFLPIAIGMAVLWAIPKIIDAWPSVRDAIRGAVSSVWQQIKDFLGLDDDDDAVASMEEGRPLDIPAHYWDKENKVWVIATTAIVGVPQGREDVINKLVPFVTGRNFSPEYLPVLINQLMGQSVAAVPQTPMIGNSVFMSIPGAASAAQEAGLDLGLVDMIAGTEGFREDAYQDTAGNWTVGFGHTGPEVVEGMKMDKQLAADTLITDIQTAQGRAATQMDNRFGEGTFANMEPVFQNLATDVAYNTGSVGSMPKLAGHMATNNMEGVMREYKRHYTTPGGVKLPLVGRNMAVHSMLTKPTDAGPPALAGNSTTPSVVPSMHGGSQMSMQTTPTTTVPGEDPPDVIVMPSETQNTSTVPVMATSSSKKTTNQQAFYSDPFYAHLGIA